MSADSISRRSWLGAAAGLGGFLASGVPAPAAPASAQRLRVGLLGAPSLAANLAAGAEHWPDLDLAVAAVWDPESGRAQRLADSLPGATAAASPDTMDVDAVVVCDHRAFGSTTKLLKPYLTKGVPVWVEGPLAYSLRQAKQLADDARGPLASVCLEEFLPVTRLLGRLARELGPITAGLGQINTTQRPSYRWAGFEAVAFGMAVFGSEALAGTRLAAGDGGSHYAYVLEYGGARPIHAIVHGLPGGEDLAWARFYGTDMVDRGQPAGLPADEAWIATRLPAALALEKMIRTRKAPQPLSEALRKTRLYLTCCYASTRDGAKPVDQADLKDSWKAEDPFPGYLS